MIATLATVESGPRNGLEPSARNYWLAHCEGFRVDGNAGRIGIVEEVRDGGADGEPLLAVRAGLLGRRLLLVPAGAVFEIVPRAMRIWLRGPVTIAGSEPIRVVEPADAEGARRRVPPRPLRTPRAA